MGIKQLLQLLKEPLSREHEKLVAAVYSPDNAEGSGTPSETYALTNSPSSLYNVSNTPTSVPCTALREQHLSELKGLRIALDISVYLYRAAYNISLQLALLRIFKERESEKTVKTFFNLGGKNKKRVQKDLMIPTTADNNGSTEESMSLPNDMKLLKRQLRFRTLSSLLQDQFSNHHQNRRYYNSNNHYHNKRFGGGCQQRSRSFNSKRQYNNNRGALSNNNNAMSASELYRKLLTRFAKQVCSRTVDIFLQHGIDVVVVFDGTNDMPSKKGTHRLRREKKAQGMIEGLQRILEYQTILLKNVNSGNLRHANTNSVHHTNSSNVRDNMSRFHHSSLPPSSATYAKEKLSQAQTAFQKCIDISDDMILAVMNELKAKRGIDGNQGVDYIVAPYEADAQCAALGRIGDVQGICSEDSDILPFLAATCYNTAGTYKLRKSLNLQTVNQSSSQQSHSEVSEQIDPEVSELLNPDSPLHIVENLPLLTKLDASRGTVSTTTLGKAKIHLSFLHLKSSSKAAAKKKKKKKRKKNNNNKTCNGKENCNDMTSTSSQQVSQQASQHISQHTSQPGSQHTSHIAKLCQLYSDHTIMSNADFVKFCIFSGCDYQESLPQCGPKTMLKFIMSAIKDEKRDKYLNMDGTTDLMPDDTDILLDVIDETEDVILDDEEMTNAVPLPKKTNQNECKVEKETTTTDTSLLALNNNALPRPDSRTSHLDSRTSGSQLPESQNDIGRSRLIRTTRRRMDRILSAVLERVRSEKKMYKTYPKEFFDTYAMNVKRAEIGFYFHQIYILCSEEKPQQKLTRSSSTNLTNRQSQNNSIKKNMKSTNERITSALTLYLKDCGDVLYGNFSKESAAFSLSKSLRVQQRGATSGKVVSSELSAFPGQEPCEKSNMTNIPGSSDPVSPSSSSLHSQSVTAPSPWVPLKEAVGSPVWGKISRKGKVNLFCFKSGNAGTRFLGFGSRCGFEPSWCGQGISAQLLSQDEKTISSSMGSVGRKRASRLKRRRLQFNSVVSRAANDPSFLEELRNPKNPFEK
eukprot:g1167.t1